MSYNIINKIVENDICIGCGMCIPICPVDVLEIDFNQIGEYTPTELPGCLDKCTLCMDVCPFDFDNNDEEVIAKELYANQDLIQNDETLGYFLETYVIHTKNKEKRMLSASGGFGNWLLDKLIETKEVDYVIAPTPNSNTEKLFKYNILSTKDDIQDSKGSVYYPVELSEVIDFVLKTDATFAITALPCFSKSIRLAQEKNKKLKKRIKYVIGLVCGQMKNKNYTTNIGQVATGETSFKEVNYRLKNNNQLANNFAYEFTTENDKKTTINWSAEPNIFWKNRLFTPTACNFCNDVFAETSDVVIMDAWRPNYIKDYKGHTFVIVRNKNIVDFINKYKDELFIEPIDYSEVIESQKSVVLLKNNNKIFSLYGFKSNIKFLEKIIIYLKFKMQNMSKSYSENQNNIKILFLITKIINRINR